MQDPRSKIHAGSKIHDPYAGSKIHNPYAGSKFHDPYAGSRFHGPYAGVGALGPIGGERCRPWDPFGGGALGRPKADIMEAEG